MEKCLYCKRLAGGDSELCKLHEFALFQISETLSEFIQQENPPEWLLDGIRELSWIFFGHPRTAAYINVSMEIADRFAIERLPHISINDIKEVNYTRLSPRRIISLLEDALIIRVENNIVYPGPLSLRLREVRDLGYPLNSPEQKARALEYHGILAISVLRSMLLEGEYIPRGALSVLTLLSLQALTSEEIQREISDVTWDSAFRDVPNRQENKMKRIMAGLLDGVTKMIHNINEDGKPELKTEVVSYLVNMRERYRERERTRTRM